MYGTEYVPTYYTELLTYKDIYIFIRMLYVLYYTVLPSYYSVLRTYEN